MSLHLRAAHASSFYLHPHIILLCVVFMKHRSASCSRSLKAMPDCQCRHGHGYLNGTT